MQNTYQDTERKAEIVKNIILAIAASKLNRVSISWEELEDIYMSKKYPDLNDEIDYIIGGEN